MRKLLTPLFAILVLGSMVYAAWSASDWGSVIACAPAILVIVAVVGGLVAGVTFFGAEEMEPRSLHAPHLAPQVLSLRSTNGHPAPRAPHATYNERKIRAHLSGIGEVLAKHVRKKKRPLEVAHVLDATCTGCGVCVPFCPSDCIELESASDWPDRSTPPVRIRYDECIGCGMCMHVCEQLAWDAAVMRPTEAIERELGIVIHDTPFDSGHAGRSF